tara:strand:+ start:347 stop:592 length:246 start_codon:yes stop_codon:yes gene_type:complete
MKKILILLLIVGAIIPSISPLSAEANVSPERVHRRRKPKCKSRGGVTVCSMPRTRRCTVRRPCVPRGYYRPTLPLSPMPLR